MDREARVSSIAEGQRVRHWMPWWAWLALAGVVVVTVLALGYWGPSGERVNGPLVQQAYVWQRVWTDSVRSGVERAGGRLDELAIWSAEVEWDQRTPRLARGHVDYAYLKSLDVPIGLVLRIGPYAGPFAEIGEPVDALAELADDLLQKAAATGISVCEMQLDFDCATSKLDGYRCWVSAVRRRIAPTPLVITALPSWLSSSAFQRLAAATDGFVLQVHSLERPRGPDRPMTLCDPAAARRAVEKAGRVGVPFRVALATYGYFVAFDQRGQLLGLQAEGPSLTWPADAQVRALRADPVATAELVRGWSADRPATMRGLIWYRLPTDADTLNWRWPTLVAVMEGRVPQGKIEVDVHHPEPGLIELDLLNTGEADAALPAAVTVAWGASRLVASDALAGVELEEAGAGQVRFRPVSETEIQAIAAGQRRPLGWLRFDGDTEVEVHVTPAP